MEAQEYYEELKMNHPSHIFEGDDIIKAFDDGVAEGWKPSDEQMLALADAIETYCGKYKATLTSLYNVLKKLAE